MSSRVGCVAGQQQAAFLWCMTTRARRAGQLAVGRGVCSGQNTQLLLFGLSKELSQLSTVWRGRGKPKMQPDLKPRAQLMAPESGADGGWGRRGWSAQ